MHPSALYFFLLVQRLTILLANGEVLQLNGLTKKSDNVSAPYFFFTCLTPDNFTRQWGSSAA
jgi:hypothetical protein